MIKKLAALTLALLMTLSMAACGGKTEAPATTAAPETTAAATDTRITHTAVAAHFLWKLLRKGDGYSSPMISRKTVRCCTPSNSAR